MNNKNLKITQGSYISEFKDKLLVEKIQKLKQLVIASIYDAYGIDGMYQNSKKVKYKNHDALYNNIDKVETTVTDDNILYGIVKYDKFNSEQKIEIMPTTTVFTPFRPADGNFDVQLALRATFTDVVTQKSRGECAKAVRTFLHAGGIDVNDRPASAYKYANWLPNKGFKHIAELRGYVEQNMFPAKEGDIAVMDHGEHGHICMWDGHQWVSDFRQRNMWPYKGEGICNIFRFSKN